MATRRMISKSISTSTKLSKVSDFAALLFTWLIPHCDDGGNMDAEPYIVRGIVMPIRPKEIADIENGLKELEQIGLITFYEVNGQKYLHIDQWEQHQTLRGDRPDYRYPAMATSGKPGGNRRSTSGYRNGTERNRTEQNILDQNQKDGKVSFDAFWQSYPRKVGKPGASRAWTRIHVTRELQEKIMVALEKHKKSKQWQKDDGQFIPHPATWLNQERWNDELEVPKQKVGNSKFESVKSTKL